MSMRSFFEVPPARQRRIDAEQAAIDARMASPAECSSCGRVGQRRDLHNAFSGGWLECDWCFYGDDPETLAELAAEAHMALVRRAERAARKAQAGA